MPVRKCTAVLTEAINHLQQCIGPNSGTPDHSYCSVLAFLYALQVSYTDHCQFFFYVKNGALIICISAAATDREVA